MEIRRVVTGHDAAGRAVVESDAPVGSHNPVEGYEGVELWETHEPGTHIRIVELAPGHRSPMHRTHSVDYALLLDGECELALDGGETVHLRAGDAVVQCGTNHAWYVVGDRPARFAFVLIEQPPVEIDGAELPATMPEGIDQSPE